MFYLYRKAKKAKMARQERTQQDQQQVQMQPVNQTGNAGPRLQTDAAPANVAVNSHPSQTSSTATPTAPVKHRPSLKRLMIYAAALAIPIFLETLDYTSKSLMPSTKGCEGSCTVAFLSRRCRSAPDCCMPIDSSRLTASYHAFLF